MVVILGDPTFGAMSGSIGGLNFYQFRGRQCVRMKAIPKQPHTPAQAEARTRFTRALNDWQQHNYSKDIQLYKDWGKSSIFRARGLVYPIRDYQFFLGYRSNYYLNPNLPSEPSEQPSERPKCPVLYPFYVPHYDELNIWADGHGLPQDYLHLWYTKHHYPQNKVLPRKYSEYRHTYYIFADAYKPVCQLTMNDEAANSTVRDRSGNALNFTFIDPTGNPNTNTHSTLGKCNKALEFDGFDDRATRVYHTDFNFNGPHAFSTWAYFRYPFPGAQTFFNCYNGIAPNKTGVRFFIAATGALGIRIYNGANDVQYFDSRLLNTDTWYHVGYQIFAGCNLYFYVNGVPSSKISMPFMPADPIGETFFIGCTSFLSAFLYGYLDDMRWWKQQIGDTPHYALFLFSPEHEHMIPNVEKIPWSYITGQYQTWFKYRYISYGGGWSPLRHTYFRHTF